MLPDWTFWPIAAFVLGVVAWSGWIAHREHWWMVTGFLLFWYVAAPLAVAGLIALRMVS